MIMINDFFWSHRLILLWHRGYEPDAVLIFGVNVRGLLSPPKMVPATPVGARATAELRRGIKCWPSTRQSPCESSWYAVLVDQI